MHDGPEYAEYAALTRFLDAMSWEERIPPLRAALIQPVDRNETYSASALYAGALVRELLPEIGEARAARPAHRDGREPRRARDAARARPPSEDVRRPAAPVGQLLPPALGQARVGFPRYRRITRFVGTVLRGVDVARPIPVAITCGTAEENRANNEAVAEALIHQGYTSWISLVRDAHNWTSWRDAFDPHLPALIEAAT